MKLTKQDLVTAEIKRAEEAFVMAGLAIEARLWNSCASELYYTCFYCVQALFLANDIQVRTHSGGKIIIFSSVYKRK